MANWLHDRESDFAALCVRWQAEFAKPGRSEFGWDETAEKTCISAINAYMRALDAFNEDDSTKNRDAKNDLKDKAKSAMRKFANSSIRYNDKMRRADKGVFNVHEPDRVPSPTAELHSFPESEGDTSIPRQVGINFWDSVSKKRAKPRGVHGAEIRWAVLDHVPAGVDELVHSDFCTKTPFTLKLGDTDRAKILYYCLRWETNANQKGPFGAIMSAVIP